MTYLCMHSYIVYTLHFISKGLSVSMVADVDLCAPADLQVNTLAPNSTSQ